MEKSRAMVLEYTDVGFARDNVIIGIGPPTASRCLPQWREATARNFANVSAKDPELPATKKAYTCSCLDFATLSIVDL